MVSLCLSRSRAVMGRVSSGSVQVTAHLVVPDVGSHSHFNAGIPPKATAGRCCRERIPVWIHIVPTALVAKLKALSVYHLTVKASFRVSEAAVGVTPHPKRVELVCDPAGVYCNANWVR